MQTTKFVEIVIFATDITSVKQDFSRPPPETNPSYANGYMKHWATA